MSDNDIVLTSPLYCIYHYTSHISLSRLHVSHTITIHQYTFLSIVIPRLCVDNRQAWTQSGCTLRPKVCRREFCDENTTIQLQLQILNERFKWFLITTTRINSRRYTRTEANPSIKSLNFEYCVFQNNMSVALLVILKNGVKSCFRHWSLFNLSFLRASCRRSLTLRLCWGSVQGYHMAMEASGHTSCSLVTDSVREIKPFRLAVSLAARSQETCGWYKGSR